MNLFCEDAQAAQVFVVHKDRGARLQLILRECTAKSMKGEEK